MTPVPGHTGYFASRDGRVFSRKRGKLHELKPVRGSAGRRYRYVNLTRATRIGVHQIVAMCFLTKPEAVSGERLVVRHRDNNPSNNHADNLRWGTQKQNLADRLEHGTMTHGERNGQTKITAELVLEIRARRARGDKCRDIAKDVQMSPQEVHRIGIGSRWRHIPGEVAPRQRRTKGRNPHASPVAPHK